MVDDFGDGEPSVHFPKDANGTTGTISSIEKHTEKVNSTSSLDYS
jgi:hypothetical protein